MDKVSVIVSTYNRSDFLRKCLLSLSAQSYRPDEVVITDDGSDGDILGAIRDISGALDFEIVYVRQEHAGYRLSKSKNNGVRHATGSYLIFNDQDVLHSRNYLRTFRDFRRRGEFLTAWPVRLDEEQSVSVTENAILSNALEKLVFRAQRNMVRKQYIKDEFAYFVKKLFRTGGHKPKLRGGVFGIYKDDLVRVNGFDEQFQGWGNEDDDLGRRLHRAGICGRNLFWNEFPIHLWHPLNHSNGHRANHDYNRLRGKAIREGDFRAVNGLANPLGDEDIQAIRIQ